MKKKPRKPRPLKNNHLTTLGQWQGDYTEGSWGILDEQNRPLCTPAFMNEPKLARKAAKWLNSLADYLEWKDNVDAIHSKTKR